MSNIKILDCTLRDGGRIINCAFKDSEIVEITQRLTKAGIDIIEIGFLRDKGLVSYTGDSTFFTNISQITPFIPKDQNEKLYTAFIDFNLYNFQDLEPCDGKSVTGIRVGFTKQQYDTQRKELKHCLLQVIEQGYHLMVQGVNTLSYSDRELLDLIDLLNEIQPYSFGIVDTYGAMYLEDMVHYYNLIDYNLRPEISIDIHAHNNLQLSFAFAQQIISLSDNRRNIILDATLNGMGKCAGNLNTELIVDYLVRKKYYPYDFEAILDIIDDCLFEIKKNNAWGYSLPSFMAGVYKSHPNNVIYLTEKYRINAKDISNLLFMIEEEKRQRYDYDHIERLYIEYNNEKVDDNYSLKELKDKMDNKEVLVIVPGHSIVPYKHIIAEYIDENNPVIISVNFYSEFKDSYVFWGNKKRFNISDQRNKCYHNIICSNVHKKTEGLCIVNYYSLINKGFKYFDNSTMMLLNLLKKLNVNQITLAGFDGFDEKIDNNFVDCSFPNDRYLDAFGDINRELMQMMAQYDTTTKGKYKLSFLTPSPLEAAIKGR